MYTYICCGAAWNYSVEAVDPNAVFYLKLIFADSFIKTLKKHIIYIYIYKTGEKMFHNIFLILYFWDFILILQWEEKNE